ncbi:MAG TPA: DNA integrity scanning protein DisA nucleotide-binding domain protein [Polyangia bacterium]|nr:DNA integrity scanning protein DisA nucleotide-binding domain protein [Polyangia bacterium]
MPDPDRLKKTLEQWLDVLEQVTCRVLREARCDAVPAVGIAYVRASWNTDGPQSGLAASADFSWKPDVATWPDEIDNWADELRIQALTQPGTALFLSLAFEAHGFQKLVASTAVDSAGAVDRFTTAAQAFGYHLVPILEFSSVARSELPTYKVDGVPTLARRAVGLFDACVAETLDWFAGELTKGLYKAPRIATQDVEAILRNAGSMVMGAVQSHTSPESIFGGDLFVSLDRVSMQRHERAEGRGTIVFLTREYLSAWAPVFLEESVPLGRTQWVRKLLEVCHGEMCLASGGRSVDALVARSELGPGTLVVEFQAQHRWTLSADKRLLMRVENGIPTFPTYGLPRERFESAFRRVFPSYGENVDPVWQTVSGMLSADHGALIVISADAESEAKKLATQGTPIAPRLLRKAESMSVARVDGAILIDPQGLCHAFGVVLDGSASDAGTPARGARFNSAIRYVVGSPQRLAVVRSEDGQVDLLPRFRPQVKQSELNTALDAVRRVNGGPIKRALREQAKLVWMYARELELTDKEFILVDQLRDVLRTKLWEAPEDDDVFDPDPTRDLLPE